MWRRNNQLKTVGGERVGSVRVIALRVPGIDTGKFLRSRINGQQSMNQLPIISWGWTDFNSVDGVEQVVVDFVYLLVDGVGAVFGFDPGAALLAQALVEGWGV